MFEKGFWSFSKLYKPAFLNASNPKKLSVLVFKSKLIYVILCFILFSELKIADKYLSSPKITEAPDILRKLITSSECSSLSIGTTVPTIDAARYVIAHL